MNKQILENLKLAMDEVASYGCVSKIDGVSVPVIMAQAAAEIERLERECKKAVALQEDYENQLSDATAQIFDKVSCIENLKARVHDSSVKIEQLDSAMGERHDVYFSTSLHESVRQVIGLNRQALGDQL